MEEKRTSIRMHRKRLRKSPVHMVLMLVIIGAAAWFAVKSVSRSEYRVVKAHATESFEYSARDDRGLFAHTTYAYVDSTGRRFEFSTNRLFQVILVGTPAYVRFDAKNPQKYDVLLDSVVVDNGVQYEYFIPEGGKKYMLRLKYLDNK